MANYTQEQLELKAHIDESNEKFVARCKAEGATAWGTTVSDPEHWAEYGIFNIAQYERYSLESYIYDAYKDAHGFRPRHIDFKSMSMDELEKMADQVSEEVAESIKQREQAENEAYESLKKHLKGLVDMGAKDFRQALEWDLDAEGCTHDGFNDYGFYCYKKGIAYSKERVISRLVA